MIVPAVVERHAAEAAWLWFLRSRAVHEPHYRLEQLARLDDRVEAHLDGLRVAGGPGWEIARAAAVEGGDPGSVFAAAVLAFERGEPAEIEAIIAAGSAAPETRRALASALGWLPADRAFRRIRPLLTETDPGRRWVGLASAALQRRNPGVPALTAALNGDDPALRARALRAVGELGLVDLHLAVRSSLKAKDPAGRFWAAWSTAILNGHRDALAALQALAEAGGPRALAAADLAARRLPPREARIWLRTLVREGNLPRLGVAVAAALGEPESVPWLVEQMKDPDLARPAGEAFGLITGARLDDDGLASPRPADQPAVPSESEDDEDVAVDPDENLAWPDPARVKAWWGANRGRFAAETRHLLGRPIEAESLRRALRSGLQRQRAAAALELALLEPGQPLFEVRAPGHVQLAALGAG